MIERSHLDLPPSVKRFGEFTKASYGMAVSEKQTGLFTDSMKLSLMLCEHGRGCGFESRHPGHPSSMLYKLALSKSGCISGKFVGNLLPIREACP